MEEIKQRAKSGPKPKNIDWDSFEKLCSLHCTLVEISEWFDVSEDTIERYVKKKYGMRFAEIYKRKSSKGKISLRRKQHEIAMTGNPTMLIWLGKQHLEQRDQHAVEQSLEIKTFKLSYERKIA